jgi:hypothetical protein
MRNWPGRLPLIALCAAGALIALVVAGIHFYSERGVLVSESGSGPGGETTEVFSAAGNWDLAWSYDCSSGLGSQYARLDQCDFVLTVKRYSDCQISSEDQGVTKHGGSDHGVVHYRVGGTFYFAIDSYGSWTFTVTGSGRASGKGPYPHCTNDG